MTVYYRYMKTLKSYINESTVIDCNDYFKDKDLTVIPVDASMSEQPQIYVGKLFKKFEYFGNCVNTVPEVWDATQMAQFCTTCKLYDINQVIDNLVGGDRKIPQKFFKALKFVDINDLGEVVCAIDSYQRIMFIYITELDIHFFFDCK